MFKLLIIISILFAINDQVRAERVKTAFVNLDNKHELKNWIDLFQDSMSAELYVEDEMQRIQRKHGDLREVIKQSLAKLRNVYSVIGRARHG